MFIPCLPIWATPVIPSADDMDTLIKSETNNENKRKFTIWPDPFFNIAGRKAFRTQKWEKVFTPNVLKGDLRSELLAYVNNILLNILNREVNDQFPLNNARIVDENGGFSNLYQDILAVPIAERTTSSPL